MEATLFLADSAQISPDGKVHALGIGWQHTSSPMSAPAAIVFILHVPWNDTNHRIKWTLDLLSADSTPISLPTGPGTSAAVHMENEIEVGRPPGIKPGSVINVPFAIALGSMPLPPDSTFEWLLRVANREFRVPFATRAAS